ncbi:MAG: MucBP domain-containing protein, partial [Erysipelotrichales bacterium]
FPIDHIFKVTKDTYKEFSVKTTAFFKPFSEEKDLIFDEEVRYEIDGKYLVYDIDYDKDTDIIHFKLNEESSDDIDYAELEEYLDDYKPETHVSLYDDKFYEHNPLENVNLGGFFFYPKLRAVEPKPVIVKYVDDKNNSISSTETITGIYGSTYTTREKKIKGYKLHKILGNTTGTISDEEQYVTYVFKKDNDMLKVQPVIIKYIDQDGKRLSNDIILKGSLNELYSTKEKSFENYKLVSQPKNKNGYFSSKKQYVIYKYSKVGSTTNRIVEAGDNTGEIVMTLILLVSFLVVSRRYVK